MNRFIKLFLIVLFFECALTAQAESLYDRKINDVPLYNVFLDQGVPTYGIEQVFAYFEASSDKLNRRDFAGIINFTQKSTEPRFYILNLLTGQVDKIHVAHGINSGILYPRVFSNIPNSFQTSLGFYKTGERFMGTINGPSVKLYGLQRSNSNAYARDIFMHGAEYVSAAFIAVNGRLGWSQGCFAIGSEMVPSIYKKLANGALIFAYHDELTKEVLTSPMIQQLTPEESYGPEVNPLQTHLEASKSSK